MRWSDVAACTRKAVYAHTNAPAREPTDKENRIFFRGHSLERDYVDFLERQHGEGSIERQVEIPWGPNGEWTGHADFYLKPEKLLGEVLSSAHASPDYIRRKMLQLVGYMAGFPEAEKGMVVIIDPSDFTEDRYPLVKTSKTYKDLLDDRHERLEQINRWWTDGELPPRVCRKPGDAWGYFCRHATHCFKDWEAPPLDEVQSEAAKRIARHILVFKDEERLQKSALDAHTKQRKALEQSLGELVDYGSHTVGSIKVTRTLVHRSPTVDMRKAEAAGFPVHSLDEFLKPGATYDLWSVEQTDETPEPQDYGDSPPF